MLALQSLEDVESDSLTQVIDSNRFQRFHPVNSYASCLSTWNLLKDSEAA